MMSAMKWTPASMTAARNVVPRGALIADDTRAIGRHYRAATRSGNKAGCDCNTQQAQHLPE
jgi:hypothetical protein